VNSPICLKSLEQNVNGTIYVYNVDESALTTF